MPIQFKFKPTPDYVIYCDPDSTGVCKTIYVVNDRGGTELTTDDPLYAINYAVQKVNSLGGGRVRIKRGTYIADPARYNNNPVSMYVDLYTVNNVTIEGDGMGETILKNMYFRKASGTETSNIIIRDLTIDANNTVPNCVYLWILTNNVVIERVLCQNTTVGIGFHMEQLTGIIRDNIVRCTGLQSAADAIAFAVKYCDDCRVIVEGNVVDKTCGVGGGGITTGAFPRGTAIIRNNVVKLDPKVCLVGMSFENYFGDIDKLVVDGNVIISSAASEAGILVGNYKPGVTTPDKTTSGWINDAVVTNNTIVNGALGIHGNRRGVYIGNRVVGGGGIFVNNGDLVEMYDTYVKFGMYRVLEAHNTNKITINGFYGEDGIFVIGDNVNYAKINDITIVNPAQDKIDTTKIFLAGSNGGVIDVSSVFAERVELYMGYKRRYASLKDVYVRYGFEGINNDFVVIDGFVEDIPPNQTAHATGLILINTVRSVIRNAVIRWSNHPIADYRTGIVIEGNAVSYVDLDNIVVEDTRTSGNMPDGIIVRSTGNAKVRASNLWLEGTFANYSFETDNTVSELIWIGGKIEKPNNIRATTSVIKMVRGVDI